MTYWYKYFIWSLLFVLFLTSSGCSLLGSGEQKLNGDAFAGTNGLVSESDFGIEVDYVLLQYRLASEQISTGAYVDDLYPAADCSQKQNRFCKALAGLTTEQKKYVADGIVELMKSEAWEAYAKPSYFLTQRETLVVEGQGEVHAMAPLRWGGQFTMNYLELGKKSAIETGATALDLGHELFHPFYFLKLAAALRAQIEKKEIPADFVKIGPFQGEAGMQTLLDRSALLTRAYIDEYVEIRETNTPVVMLSGFLPGVSVTRDYLFATGSDNSLFMSKRAPLRWRRVGGESTTEPSAVDVRKKNQVAVAARDLSGKVKVLRFDEARQRFGKWASVGDEEATSAPHLMALDDVHLAVASAAKTDGKLQIRDLPEGSQTNMLRTHNAVLSSDPSSGAWRFSKRFSFGGAYGYEVNPLTGARTCPPNFRAETISGAGGDDVSALCLADDSVPDAALFGGMYGVVQAALQPNVAVGYIGCPATYTTITLIGTSGKDYNLYVCYRLPAPDFPNIFDLRAVFGYTIEAPGGRGVSAAPTAPAQVNNATVVFGTNNVDYPVTQYGNTSVSTNLHYATGPGATQTLHRMYRNSPASAFSYLDGRNFTGPVGLSLAGGESAELVNVVVNNDKIWLRYLDYNQPSWFSSYFTLDTPFVPVSRVAIHILADTDYEMFVVDSQGNLWKGVGKKLGPYAWSNVGGMPR